MSFSALQPTAPGQPVIVRQGDVGNNQDHLHGARVGDMKVFAVKSKVPSEGGDGSPSSSCSGGTADSVQG